MALTDRELSIIGIYTSILPTLLIVYFDWRRRRAERYQQARDWMTRVVFQMRGFVDISGELYDLLRSGLPTDLSSIESVEVGIAKESHRQLINKAQDLFLSRDMFGQLQTRWNDLSLKSKNMLEDMPPYVFDEDDLLKVHTILQKYQDGEDIAPVLIKEWELANISFGRSLEKAIRVMAQLKKEANSPFPTRN